MAPSGVLDVKRIDLELSAVPRSFPYDVRLGEYALLVKEGSSDKVAAIKGPKVHASVHHNVARQNRVQLKRATLRGWLKQLSILWLETCQPLYP